MTESKRIGVDNFVTTQAQYSSVFAAAERAIIEKHGDISVSAEKHASGEGLIVRINAANKATLELFQSIVDWRRKDYLLSQYGIKLKK